MNWYSRPVCNSRSFHSWEGKLGLFWRFFLSKEVFLKQSFNSLYTFNDQIASEHGGTLHTFFKLCPLKINGQSLKKVCKVPPCRAQNSPFSIKYYTLLSRFTYSFRRNLLNVIWNALRFISFYALLSYRLNHLNDDLHEPIC